MWCWCSSRPGGVWGFWTSFLCSWVCAHQVKPDLKTSSGEILPQTLPQNLVWGSAQVWNGLTWRLTCVSGLWLKHAETCCRCSSSSSLCSSVLKQSLKNHWKTDFVGSTSSSFVPFPLSDTCCSVSLPAGPPSGGALPLNVSGSTSPLPGNGPFLVPSYLKQR